MSWLTIVRPSVCLFFQKGYALFVISKKGRRFVMYINYLKRLNKKHSAEFCVFTFYQEENKREKKGDMWKMYIF